MSDTIVRLKNIGKKYSVPFQTTESQDGQHQFWALKDASMEIKKGDRVGFYGPNGAGKSTLLDIISGVTTPTTGQVEVNGKVVALTGLDTGFNPELNGYENIKLNGMLIGMDKEEVEANLSKIISFADIGNFIHAPFFTYSAGMKFRLAFAVAVASSCDLLIVDEIFMLGDFEFQKKVVDFIKDIQKKYQDMATIFTSHLSGVIWVFSDSFYKVEQGVVVSKKRKIVWKELRQQDKEWRDQFELDKY